LFVVAALLLRAPALLYSAINYDESMYLLMGRELVEGHLPYTTMCDLKPFGLFALFSLFAALPMDGVIASRIAASITVGLTAYLLCRIAGRLFQDEERRIGLAAGLAYVVFSLADGGLNSQSELFHNAFAVLGLFLALKAMRGDPARPRLPLMALAGLVLGIGLQIKQAVLFDMLAFFVGFYLLTTPNWRELGRHVRTTAPALGILAIASILPTLLVILLYVAAGQLDAWVAANIEAHRVFYGPERTFALEAALRAAAEQAPLWAGALLAGFLAPRLARDGAERRACAFLLVWVAAIVLCQFFLRIAADHYFLQFLPALSLLAGFVLGRGVLAAIASPRAAGALLAVLAGLALFAVAKNPYIHSIYILKDRLIAGIPWAGDTPRRVAADLKPLLRPGDKIYVVGFQPAIYHLTGADAPTRFVFTGLPSARIPGRDGCAWVPQKVEMQRIMDQRPRFIVIEDGIFFAELDPAVKAILTDRLAQDYRLRATYEPHIAQFLYPFERFVMNGGARAELYELVEPTPVAARTPARG
jgi:hypothetical protein